MISLPLSFVLRISHACPLTCFACCGGTASLLLMSPFSSSGDATTYPVASRPSVETGSGLNTHYV
eukprot:5246375-Pleurochrysis_carterae.AAC.2